MGPKTVTRRVADSRRGELPQPFGREFSAQIEHFGGRKVKRRQRAYYEGCRLDEESNR